MSEIVTLVASAAYVFGVMVFIVNCSMELYTQDRKPKLRTLVVSILWPLAAIATLAVIFEQDLAGRFKTAREHHKVSG